MSAWLVSLGACCVCCVVYLLAEFIQTQLVQHDNRFIAAAVKMCDRSRFNAKQKRG